MENVNLVNEIPPDTASRLESVAAQQHNGKEAPKTVAASKAARKRTKTGCLTCRQRRIKCGEEKPICKNCTKSKRECKGYAQRLIFKNPLGIPGIPTPIPTHSLPLSSQYEGQIDLQLTSAGTHGPMLAPKRPTVPDLEQKPASLPPGGFPPELHSSDAAFAKNFSVPAQTLLPVPPVFKQRHESSNYTLKDYSRYGIDELVSSQHESEFPAAQGSSGATWSSHPHQNIHAIDPVPVPPQSTLPTHEPTEHQRGAVQNRYLSPIYPSSPYSNIDEDDDDYYDVETDEEAEEQVSMQNFNQLSLVMASANRDERQLRIFTTYLNEPNVLASYQPTFGSSPLNNPKTARIFVHFIHATGPSLSIFERHPIDPSTMLGAPVPIAQQGLWTYTLPLKAFEQQALQQAILALSSLHIAYLQQGPITVSLKHYQYALKRVGKAVGLPMRRKQLGTLAATLLLAYYEVMTADHFKWNNHIAGSAQLIREIDFAGITRDLRAQRRSRWLEPSNTFSSLVNSYTFNNSTSSDDPFAELESEIDDNMIGCMLGRAVSYDQFGQIEGEHIGSQNRSLTRKDIETFRIQCDLYWWYCKQDWIQSLLSGGPLFLPYSQWGQCPPRAGLGRLDAIYGTADHLILLMGRLADFGVRDRKRKIKASKLTGSGWRPDSRFMKFMGRFAGWRPGNQGQVSSNAPFGPPPGPTGAPHSGLQSHMNPRNGSQESHEATTATHQSSSSPSDSPPGYPQMYGMVPSSGPRRLPSAFADTKSDKDESDGHDDGAADITYEEAENEWEDILAAFDMFVQALGPDYMPLPADSTFPISSPFGPALQYRTHNMGSLWGMYYAGRIFLHRLHPSMPPAMTVAAGVVAPTTAEYAQAIGKIAAGIYGPQSRHPGVKGFSPTLGSCLIEVTVPIFVGAVQYVDSAQRAWTIAVLGDISRLTGWKTSDAIARGCERAWNTAAQHGRGPPYTPFEEGGAQQPPMWESYAASRANTERQYVKVDKPEPAPYETWAMGLLSLEDHIN